MTEPQPAHVEVVCNSANMTRLFNLMKKFDERLSALEHHVKVVDTSILELDKVFDELSESNQAIEKSTEQVIRSSRDLISYLIEQGIVQTKESFALEQFQGHGPVDDQKD